MMGHPKAINGQGRAAQRCPSEQGSFSRAVGRCPTASRKRPQAQGSWLKGLGWCLRKQLVLLRQELFQAGQFLGIARATPECRQDALSEGQASLSEVKWQLIILAESVISGMLAMWLNLADLADLVTPI